MAGPSSAVPYLPLVALCPECIPPHVHAHETSQYIPRLFDALGLNPAAGFFVDAGPASDMADGLAALSLGFNVMSIEARSVVYNQLMHKHNASIKSGNLTLLHAALSRSPGVAHIWNANDATSLGRAATGRYLEKDNPFMKEAVVVTTLDTLVGADVPCAVIKLDIQGFEHDALLGAMQLLRRPRGSAPVVFFEYAEKLSRLLPSVNETRSLATVQMLRGLGYVCYDAQSDLRLRLPDGTIKHRHRCCSSVNVCHDDPERKGECNGDLYTDFICVKRDEVLWSPSARGARAEPSRHTNATHHIHK